MGDTVDYQSQYTAWLYSKYWRVSNGLCQWIELHIVGIETKVLGYTLDTGAAEMGDALGSDVRG